MGRRDDCQNRGSYRTCLVVWLPSQGQAEDARNGIRARESNEGGTLGPDDLAVWRLMVS
jgi:hypothetical protein